MYVNAAARRAMDGPSPETIRQVEAFHRQLPEYNETPLLSLTAAAKELGVAHIFVKDESLRFGLPSFKIVGASWAIYRAVVAETGVAHGVGLDQLATAAQEKGVRLVTSTDGNWGRAVSRMAKYLGLEARVFVPKTMDEATQANVRGEGSEVIVVPGDYDAATRAAEADSKSSGRLLVQDTSWPGYEEFPAWVVEGYSTLLVEAERQIRDRKGEAVDLAVASAGVGSFAQAVTAYYKSRGLHHAAAATAISTTTAGAARVIAVEPTAAACVRTSLEAGKIVPIETGETIMDGMNCGTVSSIAWPVLRDGLDACISVTDSEAHRSVEAMRAVGANPGPCGAAPLAALRKLHRERPDLLGPDSVVLLFCTEGFRPYKVPT